MRQVAGGGPALNRIPIPRGRGQGRKRAGSSAIKVAVDGVTAETRAQHRILGNEAIAKSGLVDEVMRPSWVGFDLAADLVGEDA